MKEYLDAWRLAQHDEQRLPSDFALIVFLRSCDRDHVAADRYPITEIEQRMLHAWKDAA